MKNRAEFHAPKGTDVHLEFPYASGDYARLAIKADAGTRAADVELPTRDLEEIIVWLAGALLRRRKGEW